jgi:hypothetical protein
MALGLTLPIAGFYGHFVGNKPWGEALLRDFDVSAFMEMANLGAPALAMLPAAAGWLGAMAALVGIFLAGGAMGTLYNPYAGFAASGGRFYWRYFRVVLAALLVYGIFAGFVSIAGYLIGKAFEDSMVEAPLDYARRALQGFALLLFAFLHFAFDLAKARLAIEDSRKSVRAAFWALGAVLRRPLTSMMAASVLLLLCAAVFAAGQTVSGMFDNSPAGIAARILTQQVFIAALCWVRLLACGTAVEFADAWRPVPALPVEEPAPLPEPEPQMALFEGDNI